MTYPRQDPEDVAGRIVALVHGALNLVPEAKVMILIDLPGAAEPQGMFSQISYDRARALLDAAQREVERSRQGGLQAIASAMGSARHG